MSQARRPYRSTLREEQARATRRAVVSAARDLFVDVGWSRTTIDAVAARAEVSRGGIVRSRELHEKAQQKITDFIAARGHVVAGVVPSPITGMDGNQEFFVCARKPSA